MEVRDQPTALCQEKSIGDVHSLNLYYARDSKREREREREREKKNQVPPFPRQGDWSFGEGYAHDIMGDLNAGGGRHRISSYFVARSAYMVNHISLVQGAGWIDWNLLLNEDGGPNHVGNVCDAPVIASLRLGAKGMILCISLCIV